jgi:NAD(P)-dependent dehydrogenase (short-subunit alcohol dehydrogenase family)
MVTGANSGIGKAIALGLAQMGAAVVMVCRSRERGEAARQDIIARTGSGSVDLLLADLSSQQSIRQLAQDFRAKYAQLHVLINSAGVNLMRRSVTVDGIERTFAINHLAYFLLTNLLLDVLKSSAPARIVNITSSGQSPIQFDDLQGERQYRGFQAYTQSKTANVMFTYELARRLEGAGVSVNAVHPGVVRTNLARDMNILFRLMLVVMWPFMAPPEKGAETALYVATSPEVEGVSGKYFARKKEARSSEASYDEAAAQRLWRASAELTKMNNV